MEINYVEKTVLSWKTCLFFGDAASSLATEAKSAIYGIEDLLSSIFPALTPFSTAEKPFRVVLIQEVPVV